MIWFNQPITVLEQPAGHTINLIGIYSEPTQNLDPTIIIKLEIISSNSDYMPKVLYTDRPRVAVNEDPDPEYILNRYAFRIKNLQRRLISTKFSDLIATK